MHGPALRVPVTEDEPRTAYGEYGTGKAEIEALLGLLAGGSGRPDGRSERVDGGGVTDRYGMRHAAGPVEHVQ